MVAFVIMYGLRRINRRIPYVLVAVVVTTVISWATGYENNVKVPVEMIASSECRELIVEFNSAAKESKELAATRAELTPRLTAGREQYGRHSAKALDLKHQMRLGRFQDLRAQGGNGSGTLRDEMLSFYFSNRG